MNPRTASWFAWSAWTVILAFGMASLVLRYLNGSAITSSLRGTEYLSEILWWDILVPAAIPAYATVGAVVASRRPHNSVGWLCLALAALVAVQEAGWEYAARTFEVAPGALPLGVPVAWVTYVLNTTLILPFVLLLLFFPEGRLPSRRWRLAGWATIAVGLAGMFSGAAGPAIWVGYGDATTRIENPTAIPGSESFVSVVDALLLAAVPALLLVAVASVVVRWRRADGVERLQLKWLAFAGAGIAFAVLCGLASALVSGLSYPTVLLSGTGIAMVTVGTPLAIGVSVLRYRLYDLDLVINRALVYGSLTVLLAAAYVGGVVGLQSVLRALTGQESTLAVVASTLAIAAMFGPLRRRVQALVDRRFYRRKYDAAKTLEAFGARLREETDLEALSADLVGVARGTVQPEHASLWLHPETTDAKDGAPD